MNKLLLLLLIILIVPAAAQEIPTTEPITAANIQRLQSVAQIDYEPMDCEFATGGFELSADGEFIAALDNQQHVYVWKTTGQLVYADEVACDEPRNTTQLAFDANNSLYILEQADDSLTVSSLNLLDGHQAANTTVPLETMILAAWVDSDVLWLEAHKDNQATVLAVRDVFAPIYEIESFAYAPGNDADAIVRIGRIPPPYTVTSSREGIVKLWDIETGETLYEVDNGIGEAAVFGAINSTATHLVWRDSQNEALYLLNFETGENRFVANLNGQYTQWYFLSNDANVVLAVNFGFEPNIVAWDTVTGERMILGAYRECSRPQPDMARLSANGTSLVIGCDTGLEVWRITPEKE